MHKANGWGILQKSGVSFLPLIHFFSEGRELVASPFSFFHILSCCSITACLQKIVAKIPLQKTNIYAFEGRGTQEHRIGGHCKGALERKDNDGDFFAYSNEREEYFN